VLFENATRLGEVPWGELAAQAGIRDREEFEACVADRRHTNRIIRDLTAVAKAGLSSIPGLIINGTVVTGAKPFEVLDGLVQSALEKAM